jgi:predicted lactoylglutathione lyase
MPKQIFINLVVADVDKSMQLYQQMGFENNPQFSDDTAKCMVWSDTIFLMIMTKEKFATFASKPIADTKANLAALFALSFDSLEQVNSVAEAALRGGAIEPVPFIDYGFMQQRTIEDFDGHTWELFFMDMSKVPNA